MSKPVVLDAEAFSSLAGRATPREREVRAVMRAADRLGRDVVVPTVILAELYHGPRHSQLVDSCLSRETSVRTRDTDWQLARLVGGVLAGAGSAHLAEAHVVAVAVEMGGGLIMTGVKTTCSASPRRIRTFWWSLCPEPSKSFCQSLLLECSHAVEGG